MINGSYGTLQTVFVMWL